MDNLISLPFDLQMILVAGFLAFKVTVIGRGSVHTTEDFLLQVISFGTVARGMTMLIEFISDLSVPSGASFLIGVPNGRLFAVGLLTVLLGLVIGMAWRRWLCAWVSAAMRGLKIYRDDHEHSAWATLTGTNAKLTVVQLYLADGKILEAEFSGKEDELPMRPVTFNNDGVAIFATTVYPADKSEPIPVERDPETFGYTVTYVPKDQIRQMDVSLKR